MENNETVDDIVCELRDEPLAEDGAKPWLHYLADRIEAAWRREKSRIEADALDAGAFVEAARKLKRNCDRFDNEYDASKEWRQECCSYEENDYGGLWLVKEGCPDFNKWLFTQFEEGGAK